MKEKSLGLYFNFYTVEQYTPIVCTRENRWWRNGGGSLSRKRKCTKLRATWSPADNFVCPGSFQKCLPHLETAPKPFVQTHHEIMSMWCCPQQLVSRTPADFKRLPRTPQTHTDECCPGAAPKHPGTQTLKVHEGCDLSKCYRRPPTARWMGGTETAKS